MTKMRIFEQKPVILTSDTTDFDLKKTFECGQCFRWEPFDENSYLGVVRGKVGIVRQERKGILLYSDHSDLEMWHQYFDLDRDYSIIRKSVSVNDFMRKACEIGRGIRILQQDPWESLCSFILSQCNHITRIKGIIARLCEYYGTAIECEGKVLYSFPTPETIAGLNISDLDCLRAGYRAKSLLNAAREIADGRLNFDDFATMDSENVIQTLCNLQGVGPKVASCTMLFGLHRTDAFPVDVWMKRAVDKYFGGKDFDANAVFGENAGMAQQYIFYFMRENNIK